MPTAFVLIGAESGTENEIIRKLRAMDSVKDVYPVYGVYDIVVKIEAGTQRELKEAITEKIRGLESIKSTQTLLISE